MSSNAVAAIAVILVSGFAGCAATAKSAEPVSIPTITQRPTAAPAAYDSNAAEILAIAPDGRARITVNRARR